jgi:transcription initiation factor TFIIIB Brf1 subunit/transcription initiation factor TFIIB
MGLAATVLYLSSTITGEKEEKNNNITQAMFAKAAGVTEVTIRNISKGLRNYLDLK